MSLAVYPLTTPDLRDYPDEKSYFRAFRAFGEPVPPYRTYNSDSDDSDNQDGGLPSPTPSLDREWEHFQERKRNFIQDIREQNARYEARLARQGIYMRTRSGILKNQYELGGWDLDFCILDTQGKLDFVESIDDHIRVSAGWESSTSPRRLTYYSANGNPKLLSQNTTVHSLKAASLRMGLF